MKKFKKLLAGLLGSAMVMSSLTMTAFADNSDGVPSVGQTITDSTIDFSPSRKGNLTIHYPDGTFKTAQMYPVSSKERLASDKVQGTGCFPAQINF